MTADTVGRVPEPELATVARNLYDALMVARDYVDRAGRHHEPYRHVLDKSLARDVLERVDGALAEAGDVLEGVSA